MIEELDAGVDTVERRFETNLVLASNVEHLVLGTGIVTGNGNGLPIRSRAMLRPIDFRVWMATTP